jgi:hypothetical protein
MGKCTFFKLELSQSVKPGEVHDSVIETREVLEWLSSSVLLCILWKILLSFSLFSFYFHEIYNNLSPLLVCFIWGNNIVNFKIFFGCFWSFRNVTPNYNTDLLGSSDTLYRISLYKPLCRHVTICTSGDWLYIINVCYLTNSWEHSSSWDTPLVEKLQAFYGTQRSITMFTWVFPDPYKYNSCNPTLCH